MRLLPGVRSVYVQFDCFPRMISLDCFVLCVVPWAVGRLEASMLNALLYYYGV